jgi:hypothetical protein
MAAVGIALWTEWRSDKRIRAEHKRSDRLLREERERAAAAIEEERRLAQEREQLAQAYAVQVVEGYRAAGPLQPAGHRSSTETQSGVFLVNHGSFTITDVRAWFRHEDGSLAEYRRAGRWTGFANLPEAVRNGWHSSIEPATETVLRPWDAAIVFASEKIPGGLLGPAAEWSDILPGVGPSSPSHWVVQWTDRWGTRWEHTRGILRQIRAGEDTARTPVGLIDFGALFTGASRNTE